MILRSRLLITAAVVASIVAGGCGGPDRGDKPAPASLSGSMGSKGLVKGGKATPSNIADGDVVPAPPGVK